MTEISVVFPQPDGPDEHQQLAHVHLEVHPAQGQDLRGPGDVALGDAPAGYGGLLRIHGGSPTP